jgi:Protein of unknown function (DUF4231)
VSPFDLNKPDSPSASDNEAAMMAAAAENVPPVEAPLLSQAAAETYISRKLDPQLIWFKKKAERSKLFHYSTLGGSMVATSSIVVANSLHLSPLSTGLAVVATIATGLSGMAKFQENWVRYRGAATALETLKLRYEVGMHPFEGPDKHGLLVEEAERIFDKEQSQWAAKSAENVRQPNNPTYPL